MKKIYNLSILKLFKFEIKLEKTNTAKKYKLNIQFAFQNFEYFEIIHISNKFKKIQISIKHIMHPSVENRSLILKIV